MKIEKIHEWQLCAMLKDALKKEDYELCKQIQDEVDRRIDTGAIDKIACIEGFRRIDNGKLDYSGTNGLFDKLLKKLQLKP